MFRCQPGTEPHDHYLFSLPIRSYTATDAHTALSLLSITDHIRSLTSFPFHISQKRKKVFRHYSGDASNDTISILAGTEQSDSTLAMFVLTSSFRHKCRLVVLVSHIMRSVCFLSSLCTCCTTRYPTAEPHAERYVANHHMGCSYKC